MIDLLSIAALEKFTKKNQIAIQQQSKEIRLSAKEINEVTASIASVMTTLTRINAENTDLKSKIIQLEHMIPNNNSSVFDGGSFKE